MEIEFEVVGTPEEVWQAIATGPGISSWFVPTDIEERDGKPSAIVIHFAPGVDPRSDIVQWNPPHAYRTEAHGWMPGSPPIASEWSVEARSGGKCVVRIVQSLFASTDDWDMQLEAATGGFASFLRILQLTMMHFRGQSTTMKQWSGGGTGTEAESWAAFTAALGLQGHDGGAALHCTGWCPGAERGSGVRHREPV